MSHQNHKRSYTKPIQMIMNDINKNINYNSVINKKYPFEANNCLECVYYKDDTGNIRVCTLWNFNHMIPEIKNCDKGD